MPENACAIIILAAGSSSRLGQPKQLLQVEGQSLIRRLVSEAVKSVATVVVVTGSGHEAIAAELKEDAVLIVENKSWGKGIGGSINIGMGFLKSLNKDITTVILSVCDQPFVNAALFDEMILLQKTSGKNIVACSYADTTGTPVLFEKRYFDELQDLAEKEGAKQLVRRHRKDLALLPFEQGAIDIDTTDDYTALLQQK